ncbi:MAG: substrate-binding domain-containing protein [Gammaproteobacteria bacterium]|nr:substrate-binding domain-containing protein [Gammaproteobacteria bacterium]
MPSLVYQIEQSLLSGARAVLEAAGYPVVSVVGGYLPAADEWPDNRNWIYDYVAGQQLSGVIYYGGGVGYRAGLVPTRQLARQFGNVPVINLGSELDGTASVVADNFSGMKALVTHLIVERGFKRFAFVHGPLCNSEALERFSGFRAALAEHQLMVDERLLLAGDFTADGGRRAVHQMLQQRGPLPQVVVCANDLSATGVVAALQANGLQIPDEIAVVGFDDFEYAVALEPPLTTVHYPATDMGALAARLLLQQLAGEACAPYSQVMARPVIRRSAGDERGVEDEDASVLYRNRWKQIQARDRHACRLRFDRAVFQAADLSELFRQHASVLAEAGFADLYLCAWPTLAEGGALWVRHAVSDGQRLALTSEQARILPGQLLPPAVDIVATSRRRPELVWVVHPLGFEDQRFGYLVVAVDEVVVSFAESLGVQLSEAINRQRLQEDAIARRQELECSLDALKQAHLRLDKAEKIATLGRLVAGIGHELNTPVGAGITMASFVMEELAQLQEALGAGRLSRPRLEQALEQNRQAADSIFRSLVRCASLIELFKSSSSQGAGRQVIDVSLWEVVHAAFYRCRDELAVDLAYEVDCPQQLRLKTDVDALTSVLVHLIENAAAHAYAGQPNGRVRVEVRDDPMTHRLMIRFRDYGCGMDGERLARLFEPFNTTDRGQGRTGLGLYLVYNLVSLRLRGIVTVHSSIGKGTVFTLELPLLNDEGEEQDDNVISPMFASRVERRAN